MRVRLMAGRRITVCSELSDADISCCEAEDGCTDMTAAVTIDT